MEPRVWISCPVHTKHRECFPRPRQAVCKKHDGVPVEQIGQHDLADLIVTRLLVHEWDRVKLRLQQLKQARRPGTSTGKQKILVARILVVWQKARNYTASFHTPCENMTLTIPAALVDNCISDWALDQGIPSSSYLPHQSSTKHP